MRPNEYEISNDFIRRLIDQREKFFLGGRGIGVMITPGEYGSWDIYLERARLALSSDELEVKDGKLIFSVESGYSQYGELDLAHYLKVTLLWGEGKTICKEQEPCVHRQDGICKCPTNSFAPFKCPWTNPDVPKDQKSYFPCPDWEAAE